ncbi:MAG: GH32 C-terminal domain-containing protein, partial [Anaerolineae bacterium]|nr:GH32 C-terminal domain-containing protein [Anaerolineae bacterium]
RQPLGQWDAQALEGEWVVPDVHGRRLEIIAEFEVGTAERLGIDVQSNGTDRTRIVYNPARSQLLIGRSDTVDGSTIPSFNPAFGAPLSDTRLKLHIFVDESSVEVLAQDGLISLSAQTFVNPASDGLRLFAENGSAQLTHLEVYALDEIWAAARTQSLDLCG